jgi:hypothetical protein
MILGTATFIKNARGHSSIKHLTVGKKYQIIKRFDRSDMREYSPKMADGFRIIKDNNELAVFFSRKSFDVEWI